MTRNNIWNLVELQKVKWTDAKTVIMRLVAGRVGRFLAFLLHPMSCEPLFIDKVPVGQILFHRHANSRPAAGVPATVARRVGRIFTLRVVPLADQAQKSAVVERAVTLLPALSYLP